MSFERPPSRQPNVPAIALGGFLVGVVLWLGGACLVLGGQDGSADGGEVERPIVVATPGTVRATPTRLPDRRNCDEIRGTEYRSEAERQFYLLNCR